MAERTEQITETSQISAPLRKVLRWSPGEKWKRGNRNSWQRSVQGDMKEVGFNTDNRWRESPKTDRDGQTSLRSYAPTGFAFARFH